MLLASYLHLFISSTDR